MHPRRKQLLTLLLRTDDYTSVTELSERLNCSEKTVRNDLKALDDFLENDTRITIQRKPSVGVLLEGEEVEKKKLLYHLHDTEDHTLTQDHRKFEVIKLLLTTGHVLTMQEIAEKFYVSKSTISSDLPEIEAWLERFGLNLICKPNLGLRVKGAEKAWRCALSKVVEELANTASFVLNTQQLQVIKDVLHPYEVAFIEMETRKLDQTLDFHLTDQSIVNLTVHLAIAVKRIKQGHSINMLESELSELQKKKEFTFAKKLAKQLGKQLAIKIPEAEIGYMTLHLLGSRIRYDLSLVKGEFQSSLEKIDEEALQIVKELIQKVANVIDQRIQDDQELVIGLAIHFHSTLNRLRHRLSMTNPMLKEIKKMYRYLFEVILSCMTDLEEKIETTIPEDEVAYMVLHFQAALERLNRVKPDKTTAVIICPTGAGTSQLLEAKLSSLFPELIITEMTSITQVKNVIYRNKPDVLISTVPLEGVEDVPVITVSPLLPAHEQEMLRKFVKEIHVSKERMSDRYSTLKEMIVPELIFLDMTHEDQSDVIRFLADKLYQRGFVEKGYGEEAKEREKISSTYIGGEVAIPHGKGGAVKKPAIAVARLKKPINWSGEKVTFVMMLANNIQERETVKRLFSELANLVEDENTLRQLKQPKTALQFYKLLQ
ncbi:BglG family transcription antiterminator [Melghirimyces algeriensis]|uniref:Activator of the mannose operon, transcriptional antiterminator n=1 Tax=Melghirimyces algeriensis TaxID=910412 RepID=A0A521FJF5_9BACL|nr:BglG family transcription antiterminator [Melghirimyces algeriensis]SMO95701.1 activator of the mannose operon, transcriptional antiterminator [Melghirimyces algeriensis]